MFIEVTVKDSRILLNVNHIVQIGEDSCGTYIALNKGEECFYKVHVQESMEDIRKCLRLVTPCNMLCS